MEAEGFLEIKRHTIHKYNILRKYLRACEVFNRKYDNFAFVDTHGGSGKVIIDGNFISGSPLIAAETQPDWPCFVVEVNNGKFARLTESTEDIANVKLFHGDCNKRIDEILGAIPTGKRFVVFFVDPDGLIYRDGEFFCYQLLPETLRKISNFPRSEIVLNFPVSGVVRLSETPGTIDYVKNYLGKVCDDKCGLYGKCNNSENGECRHWQKVIKERDIYIRKIKKLLFFYMDKFLYNFRFKGAFLIKNEKKVPLYYLIYGTNNSTGAKIMRDIMRIEWGRGQQALVDWKVLYKTKYILESFVFD